MSVLGAIGSVFLGAMLAFVVENVRERRMLRAWTERYLAAVAGSLVGTETAAPLVRDAVEGTRGAVAALLAEEQPEWEALRDLPILVPPDLLGSLQGSALTVVDAETVVALGRVEATAGELALRAGRLHDLHGRLVLPLYLARPERLDESQRRGLELFGAELTDFEAGLGDVTTVVRHALSLLGR
ncbi:hypothetical protein [Nocardioides aquiterrae]|uniref:Uncharacterized protein n=1 Tax=Nocardioides aquiterrae TaxID=203799 RepID=A0ABN1UCU1_9ACTN